MAHRQLIRRPTQRATTVLDIKAVVAVKENTGRLGDVARERLPVAQHSAEDGEELAHTGGECHFLFLATFQHSFTHSNEAGRVRQKLKR